MRGRVDGMPVIVARHADAGTPPMVGDETRPSTNGRRSFHARMDAVDPSGCRRLFSGRRPNQADREDG